MPSNLPDVFCATDYYLPGFKGGGPIRTLANMRAVLEGEVQLSVFTRDRDLGGNAPYPDILPDRWQEREGGPVFYASPPLFGRRGVRQAMHGRPFDILYLNSFFSTAGSIAPYLACRRRGIPILVAPRGEFSPGALAIKRWKKQLFLRLARTLRLYRDVEWHASTPHEAEDIERVFPAAKGHIHLAADPVALTAPAPAHPKKVAGSLRLAFISRISPMKNLDGLLAMLAGVSSPVTLSIYGPREDKAYWELCRQGVVRLPANIKATYAGELRPEEVSATFAQHDLFAFPTHGENFGHVIFEALQAGTPVLVSDETPWESDPSGAITAIPLDSVNEWRKEIARAVARDAEAQEALRVATLAYARHYAQSSGTRDDNLAMFRAVARKKKEKP